MQRTIRIGTRESELALWQANHVRTLLENEGIQVILVPIKSEGDVDLITPLYEMGVQGIFTRTLDIALLNDHIDLAVHSMKDVPVQLPAGIVQAAILKRGSPFDLLVFKTSQSFLSDPHFSAQIATSSIRRKAQWLHRFPHHHMHNLRGNVNTRLEKLKASGWDAAIFAEAGLARINKIPANSIVLDWMLPAPAQGAILAVCRKNDKELQDSCQIMHDENTAWCTSLERQFLRTLLGGCSTPISAYATLEDDLIHFKGNMLSPDGIQLATIEKKVHRNNSAALGTEAALELLTTGGDEIIREIRKAGV